MSSAEDVVDTRTVTMQCSREECSLGTNTLSQNTCCQLPAGFETNLCRLALTLVSTQLTRRNFRSAITSRRAWKRPKTHQALPTVLQVNL